MLLPFIQQKPCQKVKLLKMSVCEKIKVSENGHIVRYQTLEVYGNDCCK